jgi:ATP-dependent DNA ligase
LENANLNEITNRRALHAAKADHFHPATPSDQSRTSFYPRFSMMPAHLGSSQRCERLFWGNWILGASNLLQTYRSTESHIIYYVFDVMMLEGRDLTQLPLSEGREVLRSILPANEHLGISIAVQMTAQKMIALVREQGIEGIVAKRTDSIYQPGKRTGSWTKHRISLGQEFVIGGYVPSNLGVDSLVIGFYRGSGLIYAGRVRAGFVPATRRQVFEQIKHLKTDRCPFANLPEKTAGRLKAVTFRYIMTS